MKTLSGTPDAKLLEQHGLTRDEHQRILERLGASPRSLSLAFFRHVVRALQL